MNRRNFVSTLLGAAGAPLVPWRGLINPLIVLPTWERPHVCNETFWCNHPSHLKPATPAQILADIERAARQFVPTHVSIGRDGQYSLGGYITGTVLTVR